MARRPEDVSPRLRRAIIDAYKGQCQYCRADGADRVDHIIAVANGGTCDPANLTLACDPCNSRKSSLCLAEGFVEILRARAKARHPTIERLLARKSPTPRGLRAVERKAKLLANMERAYMDRALILANLLFGEGWEDDPNPRPIRALEIRGGRVQPAASR